jgi:drug/metabolite transporter (DMT)-like permease
MSWFLLAVISYLMLALVNLGDKFVVDKLLKSGKAYAFSVGVLGSLVFVIAPWFLKWPGTFLLLINFLAGAFFIFALWLMYEALKNSEMSRVVVVIGSIVPVFTIIFSVLFFKESFSLNQCFGLLLLISGMFIISFVVSQKRKWSVFWGRIKMVFLGSYKKRWVFLAIASAFFYSLFFMSTKYAYNHQDFLSSFLWIRLGGLLVALLFFVDSKSRKEIVASFRKKNEGNGWPGQRLYYF